MHANRCGADSRSNKFAGFSSGKGSGRGSLSEPTKHWCALLPLSPPDPNRGLPRRQSRLPWAGRGSLLLRAGATGP